MNFEIGLLAAFGAMFCWGIGDFLIQRTTRKAGDFEALAFIGLVGSVGLLPFVLPDLPLLFSPANLVLLVFIGLITFVSAIIDFEALKKGKLSVVEVILEIELPITAILGFLFFRETLSVPQLLIISIIFAGIVLIAVKSFFKGNPLKGIEKGALMAVLAAFGVAFINFFTAVGSKEVSPIMVVWFPWLVFTVISVVMIWKREGLPKFVHNAKRFKWLIIAMGIFDTLAWILFATAVLQNELAVVTAITEGYVAVALFLGVWFNKEKILVHQYAGAAMVFTASIALAFFI